MASSGPNNPSTVATVANGFSTDWSSPSNIGASDNNYATTAVGRFHNASYWLQATNFGFSIPAGATIDGIVVEVERLCDVLDEAFDYGAFIIKGGSMTGTDKKYTAAFTPTSDTIQSYGGASDLWGTTWTPSDINASNFGFSIAYDNTGGSTTTIYVDHIKITVYYTEAAGGALPVFHHHFREQGMR